MAILGKLVSLFAGASLALSVVVASLRTMKVADKDVSFSLLDSLSFLFLIQFLHVTSRLNSLPSSYSENFSSEFAWGNLQLPAPRSVRHFLASWGDACDFPRANSTRVPWASEADCFFADGVEDDGDDDDIRASSVVLSSHCVFFCVGLGALFLLRVAFSSSSSSSSSSVLPAWARFPLMEVVAVLAMAMGALDAAAGVLVDPVAAPGWRLVGALEIALALLFLAWFSTKAKAFVSAASWIPAMNVAPHRLYSVVDKDGDGVLSYEEVRLTVYFLSMRNSPWKPIKSLQTNTNLPSLASYALIHR